MSHNKLPPIIVAGGGHSGIEAAHAIARMGMRVIIITMDPKSIGRMSCNPAIGGLAKGHLVKEIDALGGLMGFFADAACLQFKTLNKSKGRAVWSPRAQVDKIKYSRLISEHLNKNNNISVLKGEITGFVTKNKIITHARLADKSSLKCSALIITSGTFLNGLIHTGDATYRAGRLGEKPSAGLSEELSDHGFNLSRLKTGTPPRLLKNSIDFSCTEKSLGENTPFPFSLLTKRPFLPMNDLCYIVNTNTDLHEIINDNVNLSPMYSGKIKALGPRYCPSIEDKIVRFNDKPSHQLFLEPEWKDSEQIYLNGFSTSLPQYIQRRALTTIKAFKNVKFIRPGYAIEYDYLPSRQLKSTLETKHIGGLFSAGQINGTSGYEEAAAQGLIAGINAALYSKKEDPFILSRCDAYIGVLIDDLVTKLLEEPYRMFTSSAEFRISLRPDNASTRLTKKAHNIGLIEKQRHLVFKKYSDSATSCTNLLNNSKRPLKREILQNKTNYHDISLLDDFSSFSPECIFMCETDIKYEGYIKRELFRLQKINSLESKPIPQTINYKIVKNITNEAKEKLFLIKPETLGQASRIGGVTPADIAALSIHLRF